MTTYKPQQDFMPRFCNFSKSIFHLVKRKRRWGAFICAGLYNRINTIKPVKA